VWGPPHMGLAGRVVRTGTHWKAHRRRGNHTVWCLSRRNAIAYVLGTPYHLLAPVGRYAEP